MNDSTTVTQAVGEYLSRVRRENGYTLDQVARAGRTFGASWSASSVSNIERGQASLTLPTLLLLALALGELTGRAHDLPDLLGDARTLSLAADGGSPVTRAWIDAALNGSKVTPPPAEAVRDGLRLPESDSGWTLEEEARVAHARGGSAGGDQFAQMLDEYQMPPEPELRMPARPAAGLAEERAARKLGITVARLRGLAIELWGCGIEEESFRRAGGNGSPQARGRVTRVLVDELRAAMDRGH